MIKMLKNIFGKKKETEYVPDPPGRTFKRVLTGRYFGCEDMTADATKIVQAKKEKIDQIRELELIPMFIRYTYENSKEQTPDKKILSAHVAFQKEVFAQKWNMIHITEVSFTVNQNDFDEFEHMSGVQLTKDFRDLTPKNDAPAYEGEERRKKKREA